MQKKLQALVGWCQLSISFKWSLIDTNDNTLQKSLLQKSYTSRTPFWSLEIQDVIQHQNNHFTWMTKRGRWKKIKLAKSLPKKHLCLPNSGLGPE